MTSEDNMKDQGPRVDHGSTLLLRFGIEEAIVVLCSEHASEGTEGRRASGEKDVESREVGGTLLGD
jgi:hypothetical protein